jgi:hypothetical protein
LLEGCHAGLRFRVVRHIRHQHADPPHPVRLLRPRRERPSSRAAEQRYELAPLCMTGKEHFES